MIYVKFFFKFLPEIFEMIKLAIKLSQDGIEDIIIKRRFKRISESFANPDRAQAARDLDNVFDNKKLH